MVLGPTHGINAYEMSYEVCKCVLPKVKRKTQKPITPKPLCFFSFLFLSDLTTTFSHSPAFSLLIPSSTFYTLSPVLTLLSLSHSLHQFTSFPPSSLFSLCFYFLWIPASHHAVTLTALFFMMTSS